MLIHHKIRMHLAAGGAPIAVKHRAVEPVNKVKMHPVVAAATADRGDRGGRGGRGG
jgi:hypothetical protein